LTFFPSLFKFTHFFFFSGQPFLYFLILFNQTSSDARFFQSDRVPPNLQLDCGFWVFCLVLHCAPFETRSPGGPLFHELFPFSIHRAPCVLACTCASSLCRFLCVFTPPATFNPFISVFLLCCLPLPLQLLPSVSLSVIQRSPKLVLLKRCPQISAALGSSF